MDEFSFEKLQVYQFALQWIDRVEDILGRIKGKVSPNFSDQLSRAALSIALNIAEGNGRWHKAEKRNFFWIARGSAFECVPLIQILQGRKLISESEFAECRTRLTTMGKMLTQLVKSQPEAASFKSQ
jgi:four helix bundle protein